ncbi:MAG: MSMEG_0567/Sll0786 family nitrogen starvation N-acetyltransferase [Cyanobacteria bacterium J06638_22]
MAWTTYSFEVAQSPQDLRAYFRLRQSIFCKEQGLFSGSDEDDIDAIAYPIIAVEHDVIAGRQVVGVVRIYEAEPRLWYGGRLGVHPAYRRVGRIGQGLIYKAVTTANTWGCDRFLATVQLQNVRFFRRQHWETTEKVSVCDRPHHLMEADLTYYPPGTETRPVLLSEHHQVS